MSMTKDKTIEALEKEAARRRKEVTEKANVPLPSRIKSIESTSVVCTIAPRMLPFEHVDVNRLEAALHETYHLRYRRPTPGNLGVLMSLGLDTSKLTDENVMMLAAKAPEPRLVFENGRYPTGQSRFVAIEEVLFSRENIAAKVSGITALAELVIAEAFDIFWQASGAVKEWGSPEVQEQLQMISYQTSTKVDFEGDVRKIMNKSVCDYLDGALSGPDGLGAKMTSCSRYDAFKPSANLVSSWTFDELYFRVHTFNSVTGRSETSLVHIDTQTRDEHGRGIALVTTELPFDDHSAFVDSLISAVQSMPE